MHRKYMRGVPLNAIARQHDRGEGGNLTALFLRRGMPLKPRDPRCDPKTGQWIKKRRPTWAEVKCIIRAHGRIGIPKELNWLWREWSMNDRGRAIEYMRQCFPEKKPRPTGFFSRNVKPFDYTTPAARAMAAKLNQGLDSREWVTKIDLKSQGVIWDGRLWFWSGKAGYVEGCAWTPERGRPLLNRTMWERYHGRAVPPSHVVRHADGNSNNFAKGNLVLAHRNEVARENQSAALTRKSRQAAARLLERSQDRGTSKQNTDDILTTIRGRAA